MDPINQAGKKSNKVLYVVIGIIIILLLGYLVGRSLKVKKNMNIGGYNAEVSKNFDGSTTVKSDYGTVTTGSNKLPDNWPSDAPVYENANITNTMDSDPTYTSTSGSTVQFTTTDSISSVVSFYKKGLSEKGWTMMGEPSSMGATTMISARKDSRIFSAVVMNGSVIRVTVTVSEMPNPKTPNQ